MNLCSLVASPRRGWAACQRVCLEHFGHEVRPDPFAISVPGLAKLSLVLLVLVFAAKDQHQGRHDGQVVDQQVNLASGAG